MEEFPRKSGQHSRARQVEVGTALRIARPLSEGLHREWEATHSGDACPAREERNVFPLDSTMVLRAVAGKKSRPHDLRGNVRGELGTTYPPDRYDPSPPPDGAA